MLFTWLMQFMVGKSWLMPASLLLSLSLSQKLFSTANGIVRWGLIELLLISSCSFFPSFIIFVTFFLCLFQALYYQFGIKLHNVMDTQVSFWCFLSSHLTTSFSCYHVQYLLTKVISDSRITLLLFNLALWILIACFRFYNLIRMASFLLLFTGLCWFPSRVVLISSRGLLVYILVIFC